MLLTLRHKPVPVLSFKSILSIEFFRLPSTDGVGEVGPLPDGILWLLMNTRYPSNFQVGRLGPIEIDCYYL